MKPRFGRGATGIADLRPKPVQLGEEQLVRVAPLLPGRELPICIEPAYVDLDPLDWALRHRDFVRTLLLRTGAVLFRNLQIESAERFESFAAALCPDLFGEYGDLPRAGITARIYSSTPYPAEEPILFHNEGSHLRHWPGKIFFFCIQSAVEGGETPIADCRKVYNLLSPATQERLKEKRLMYVRNFVPGLDVSWQTFFGTDRLEDVEAKCGSDLTVQWNDIGGLQVRQICDAIRVHPVTGETAVFNQIQLYHPSFLPGSVRESLLAVFKCEHQLPRNVYYGDGTPIESSVIDEVTEAYKGSETCFPWRNRDVLLLDNMLVAHSRRPYVGSRKIAVAMGDMQHDITNNR